MPKMHAGERLRFPLVLLHPNLVLQRTPKRTLPEPRQIVRNRGFRFLQPILLSSFFCAIIPRKCTWVVTFSGRARVHDLRKRSNRGISPVWNATHVSGLRPPFRRCRAGTAKMCRLGRQMFAFCEVLIFETPPPRLQILHMCGISSGKFAA